MGTFTHAITMFDPSGQRSETVEATVDTGSTFTLMPTPLLERLGAVPRRTIRLRQASGQIIERSLEDVEAQLNGVRGIIACLLGEPNDPPIIGAVTLETFLLGVDPVEQRLVPVVGLQL